jgi:hypothetical protein
VVTSIDGKLPDGMTLGEARQWMRDRLDVGDRCPCCNRHTQVYRWSLYSTAVRALSGFYRLGSTEMYVHTNRLKDLGHKGQGDTSRLRYWGLLEEEKSRREDGGRAGFWRVTEKGCLYLRDEVKLPKYAWVYDGEVMRFEGALVGVREALGTKFSYEQMMAGLGSGG